MSTWLFVAGPHPTLTANHYWKLFGAGLRGPPGPVPQPSQALIDVTVRHRQRDADVSFAASAVPRPRCAHHPGAVEEQRGILRRGMSPGNPGPDVEAGHRRGHAQADLPQ